MAIYINKVNCDFIILYIIYILMIIYIYIYAII